MSLARYLSKLGALLNSDGKVPQAALSTNVAGTGPAFNAYLGGSNQSMTSAVPTKITLNTELYDTNNAFNSTGSTVGTAPAYSFNPQVAGYYQISVGLQSEPSTSPTRIILVLYKNGELFAVPQDFAGINSATSVNPHKTSGSMLMYLNGSTDYVEFYVYIFAATPVAGDGNGNTWMTGALVRAA